MFEAKLVNRVSVEEELPAYRVGPQLVWTGLGDRTRQTQLWSQVYLLREVSRKYAKVRRSSIFSPVGIEIVSW